MNIDLAKLPTEIDALQSIIITLYAEQEVAKTQTKTLEERTQLLENKTKFLEEKDKAQTEEILRLNEKLRMLREKLYGKSSEKLNKKTRKDLKNNIENLELRLNRLKSEAEASNKEENDKGQAKRNKLPEHLEREEVEILPDLQCSSCGGEEFEDIGEDTSEL